MNKDKLTIEGETVKPRSHSIKIDELKHVVNKAQNQKITWGKAIEIVTEIAERRGYLLTQQPPKETITPEAIVEIIKSHSDDVYDYDYDIDEVSCDLHQRLKDDKFKVVADEINSLLVSKEQGQKEAFEAGYDFAHSNLAVIEGESPDFETWYDNLNTPNKPEEKKEECKHNDTADDVKRGISHCLDCGVVLNIQPQESTKEQVEEKTEFPYCPECMKATSKRELSMFNGYCAECCSNI